MNRFTLIGLLLIGCDTSEAPVAPSGDVLFDADGVGAAALAQDAVADLSKQLAPGTFAPMRVTVDAIGMAHVRMQQHVDGVPVFGGEVIVHVRQDGIIPRLTDDSRVVQVADTTPLYTADEALAAALTWAAGEAVDVSLWILPQKGGDHLAWRVTPAGAVDVDGQPSRPVVFIDAHTGEELWRYEDLKTASLSDSDQRVYNMKNGTSFSRATLGDSSDSDLLTSYNAVADVLDYFNTQHGRDSYNGSGAVVSSYGHYSRNYVNAYWDGSRLVFGDGDGYYANYLGVGDVVFHEFAHGVTDYTANLTYSNESGALNEATSDIFAAAAEAYTDGATSADTWDIGEDCWIEPGTTALRYMDSPSDDGASRDHYSNRYTGTADSGGVHYNSGIGNHFFYLLSEGGQHHTSSYRSGYTVTGIGIEDAAAIWYAALTGYMTSSTNFSGARTATESACSDLGYSSSVCDSVSYAWYEVGVGSDPAGGGSGGGGGDTGGGGGLSCSGDLYTGSLSGAGASEVEPDGTYAYYSSFSAELAGPSSADYDLYLYRWSGRKWTQVASATASGSSETISYSRSGYYYVTVVSYSGSGSYELCIN